MKNKFQQPYLIRNGQILIVILISFFAYPPITKSDIGTPNPINKLILASAIKPKKQPVCSYDKSILSSNSTLDYLNELRQLAASE